MPDLGALRADFPAFVLGTLVAAAGLGSLALAILRLIPPASGSAKLGDIELTTASTREIRTARRRIGTAGPVRAGSASRGIRAC